MSYASNIKRARRAAGLTQQELAQKVGIATITLQQYERGVREPRLERLKEIAAACAVPLAHLTDIIEDITTVHGELYMFENLLPGDCSVESNDDAQTATVYWPDGSKVTLTLTQIVDLLDETEDYFRIRLERIKERQK